jgi:hypothetical protein
LTPRAFRGGTLVDPLPLDSATAERFIRTIEGHYPAGAWDALQRIAMTARSIPLSDQERSYVRVTLGNDPQPIKEIDAVRLLALAVWAGRACETWRELRTWMSAEEQQRVLVWARQNTQPLDLPSL